MNKISRRSFLSTMVVFAVVPTVGIPIPVLAKPSTLDPAIKPDFGSFNKRRILTLIENEIEEVLSNCKFEINDECTRRSIAESIRSYVDMLNKRRDVYQFQVMCNEINNTPEIIDKNDLVVDVYVKLDRSIQCSQVRGHLSCPNLDVDNLI